MHAREEPIGVQGPESSSGHIRMVHQVSFRLHKIIKGPSGKEIITGKDQTKYVNDCLRRVEKISKVGIDLILVFDGGPLPRKLKEE